MSASGIDTTAASALRPGQSGSARPAGPPGGRSGRRRGVSARSVRRSGGGRSGTGGCGAGRGRGGAGRGGAGCATAHDGFLLQPRSSVQASKFGLLALVGQCAGHEGRNPAPGRSPASAAAHSPLCSVLAGSLAAGSGRGRLTGTGVTTGTGTGGGGCRRGPTTGGLRSCAHRRSCMLGSPGVFAAMGWDTGGATPWLSHCAGPSSCLQN